MALWAAIAVAWLLLGAHSRAVPWGTPTMWIVFNAFVAGAALGVACRGTFNSLMIYLFAAFAAGSIRSMAYLSNGAGGPTWVWAIVALTNVALLGRWSNA